jgi:cytochrome c peroxidase
VYRAEHVVWHRPVALKFFKQQISSEDAKESFLREGALINELSRRTHAVAQSYDVGIFTSPRGERMIFTALEWLDGKTLAMLLRDERAAGECCGWPLERVVATLDGIAEALAIVHDSGIAHRDIKPSNIFLIEGARGSPAAKLLDFGIAKVAGEASDFDSTASGVGGCTFAYAAPEQLARAHGPTGPWTDVYALAIVCVELLCGRNPAVDCDLSGVIELACDVRRRPTPRAVGIMVPDDIEQIFRTALAVHPQERYPDARYFWRALKTAVAGEKVTRALMRPPSAAAQPPRRPARGPRRRRLLPIVLATLGLLLVSGLIYRMAHRAPAATASSSSADEEDVRADIENEHIDSRLLQRFGALPQGVRNADNPITDEKARLGRMLFWDPLLSRNRDVACETCHSLGRFGVDGLKLSSGTGGRWERRNTLSVFNSADASAFMWDGAATDIEQQVMLSLTNPREMDISSDDVLGRLRGIAGYREAFHASFPGDAQPISMTNLARAIGSFERQLLTPSRWDAYLQGDDAALPPRDKAGFNIFVEVGCATCHFGPYVGLTMVQKLGRVQKWPDEHDRGRYELTKRDSDWMVFRVPSLRNVARTGPYFHDGSIVQLRVAVRMMARHQLGKELTPRQIRSIVLWLRSLTGNLPEALMTKPELPPR